MTQAGVSPYCAVWFDRWHVRARRFKTQNDIDRYVAQGYGQGLGADYKPWLRVQDVPSRGRSRKVHGLKTGRVHHVLSDLEYVYLTALEFSERVLDIREQFPLFPLTPIQDIARQRGIRYPLYAQTTVPFVMTTDFVVTVKADDGSVREFARTVKYADDLSTGNKLLRTLEKLELERAYWLQQDVDWQIVTEQSVEPIIAKNLIWLRGSAQIDGRLQSDDLHARFVESIGEAGTHDRTLSSLLRTVCYRLCLPYENVGAPGKARVFSAGKRPGRPPRHSANTGEHCGKILGDDDKSFIKIGYSLYKNNEVASVTDAYHRTLRRFYVEEHVVPGASTSDLTLKPLDQLPSIRQFSYWGRKAFDDLTVLRSRAGERRWQKDHRGLTGRANNGVYGPCHRFEIDATIADIYLVSRYNRNWVIGRPVIYVVVDVFSTMIAGIFVGLEGPSWNGARHALFNAFTDKVAFCRMYGIEIESSTWPSHHLPRELMADRGEMLGQAAEGIVTGLGIDIAIAPPFRPDWKAIVEGRFRLLNKTSQIHWIPGAVRERIAERGERDYRLDAVLDLAEFTNIMISSVLHYNHHSRRPERLTADMIREEIEPSPVNLWRWGMENGLATPNTQPQDLVYLHLLPRDTASIQRGGICFKGMYYTCADAIQQNWFARARKDGRRSVTVWYDPNDTAHVWLRDGQRNFVRCDLLDSEERGAQRRLEEVLDMVDMIRTPSAKDAHATLSDKIHLDAHIEAVVGHARLQKRAVRPATPLPVSRQAGDIKTHRAFERAAEQRRSGAASPVVEPRTPDYPTPAPASSSVAEAYAGKHVGEVLSLLGRLRKKGG